MADNKYNFNRLWTAYSATGNETLSISVYNGASSFVMFKKGSETRTPAVKMNLSAEHMIALRDIIKNLLDGQPDTRCPFTQMEFDREARTYKPRTNFVFFKDEKKCYGVEISNKMITTPVKFMFRAPATFTVGSEPLTDEKKSLLALRALDKLLADTLNMANLLSRFNMENPTRQRPNNRPSGGGNRDEGSKDPFRGASANNNDDVWA